MSRRAAIFPFFDEFPKTAGVGKFAIFFIHGQVGTVEKVAQSIAMKNAVDEDALGAALEINSVIRGAVAVEAAAIAFDRSEMLGIEIIQIIREHLEFREQFELEFLRKNRHLGGAYFIENDLEHGSGKPG